MVILRAYNALGPRSSETKARPAKEIVMSQHHPVRHSAHQSAPFLARLLQIAAIGVVVMIAQAAQAAVQVTINKDTQRMTVAVDGVPRYTWPVSTGVPSHETPNGTFRAFRMEADHYSKEWDDAPMPHSIFFTKIGHAIHGTDSVRRLGAPASHGCVRLSRENAATLYDLVEKEGVLNTTVTLTGSSQVAIARGAGSRTATARDDSVGDPVQLTPGSVDSRADTSTEDVYVDQYGRPLGGSRNRTYVASPFAGSSYGGRRVYQPAQRYDNYESDAYYARPYQPRSFFYYNQ